MRSPFFALLAAFVLASPASAVRIWFSTSGVSENEPIPGTPGEFINYNTGLNPALDANNGTGRLYVWGSLAPEDIGAFYTGLSLDVFIRPYAGDAAFVDHRFYNHRSTLGLMRWGTDPDQGDRQGDVINDVHMLAGLGYGFCLDAYFLGDTQYDFATHSMLLGFVELAMTPDARADVFLGLGRSGFNRQPPISEPIVSLGWDDEPLRLTDFNQQSRLPDAKIVPEPASACLLLAAGALGLRRRGAVC